MLRDSEDRKPSEKIMSDKLKKENDESEKRE